jgi:PTH1 family peptidyl-tRNA hydrolase
MILIGLRNFEQEYKKTRHNAGAIVLEYLVKEMGEVFVHDKFVNSQKAVLTRAPGAGKVYLPNTFMNLSGESVGKIIKQARAEGAGQQSKVFVFFDDVTIPVGQYKISVGEGASSHNGIRSIVENIKSLGLTKDDFVRVRIGVGKIVKDENVNGLNKERLYEPGPERMSDFVLSNLNNLEVVQIQSLAKEIFRQINEGVTK